MRRTRAGEISFNFLFLDQFTSVLKTEQALAIRILRELKKEVGLYENFFYVHDYSKMEGGVTYG